ncbi:MAG TPA: hypothetical protein VGJ94_00975 [Syntrophorhabdaceae bacterium]|jgi:hypothetical protein
MFKDFTFIVFIIIGSMMYTAPSLAQMDCSRLDPRASVSIEREEKIKASVNTLFKVVRAGGAVEGRAKKEIQNLQQDAPVTERGLIKLRTLYLFCGMIANDKSISAERKVEMYKEMMDIESTTGEPRVKKSAQQRSPKVSRPKKHVAESKINGRDTSLNEGNFQPPNTQTTISVVSQNQTGGITAQNITVNKRTEPISYKGILMPANDPDPAHSCNIPPDALKVFLGNSVAWHTGMGVHTVLLIHGRDLLKFEKRPDGLFVSTTIIRDDGRQVAEIKDNQFSINTNNYFELKNYDRHGFEVFDKKGRVFYVRYLNENAILFLGKFQVPGHSSIIVEEDKIILPHNNTFSKTCLGPWGIAAFNLQ